MWRKLNREDFSNSNPLVVGEKRRHYEFSWFVYCDYEVVGEGKGKYLKAVATAGTPLKYIPLVDTPYLFLDFARLRKRKDVDEVIRTWVAKYGLLGLQKEHQAFRGKFPPGKTFPPKEYKPEGGPSETLAHVWREVQRAGFALRMYEAALSKDLEKLEQAWKIQGSSPAARSGQRYFRSRAEQYGSSYVDALIDGATHAAVAELEEVVAYHAYPSLTHHTPLKRTMRDSLLAPELLTSSIWPRSLLGAMYTQFYWLMVSGSELFRCKYCDRTISYAPPQPGRRARKPRKDKMFCSTQCRQNYHYHNRTKVSRQSNPDRGFT